MRTDRQIVIQTNQLARICLAYIGSGYAVTDDHRFFEAPDPRSRKAWKMACEIQEFMTATDPNDALANIDGDDVITSAELVEPVALTSPAHVRQFLDISTAHLSPASSAWLSECATLNHGANYHGVGHGGAMGTLGATLTGYFMHAPVPPPEGMDYGMPAELRAVCDRARSMECDFILFEADAEALAGLPIFDDEGNRDVEETAAGAELDDGLFLEGCRDAEQTEREHASRQELQEIADGAYGDGPAIRGQARDALAAMGTPAPQSIVATHALKAASPAVWGEIDRLRVDLRAARDLLKAGRDLIEEAMHAHIYDESNGDIPPADCPFAAHIRLADELLAGNA